MKLYNQKCRICDSRKLKEVVVLPLMPFTDEFVNNERKGQEYLSDITIVTCTECGITQNLNDTNMDNYYNDYEYSVGSSGFANQFMRTLASKVNNNYFNDIDFIPTVLEIGSGSGEQLEMFKTVGFNVIGVEPSSYLSNVSNKKGILTINDFFYDGMIKKIPKEFQKLDCIISSYTFDHIPYLNETFQALKKLIKQNGKLVIEVHDLDLIINRKEFCLFEHEHYIYLNKKTAKYLFEKNGFEILSFEILNDKEKRGNSLLIIAELNNRTIEKKIDVLNQISKVGTLNKNIYSTIEKIDNWLEKNKNKKIVAYGAGGRGVMTISALKNFSKFNYVVDKNPKGQDVFLPKTHIQVFKPEELSENIADLIFVFSYGYFNEIVAELKQYGYEKKQFVSLLDFA